MILEAIDINKFYRQQSKSELYVLREVNLQVERGEVVAIVGPSGAGKSTLLHILGGLDRNKEGRVLLDGEEVYSKSDVQLAKMRNEKIGFVFQFYHLLPEFSALENVVLPLLVKEKKAMDRKAREKGLELLERVGLKDRSGHSPVQLSGGEQQRVAIARALINDPAIILCDEPTGNLDSQSGEDIINLLLDLNKKNQQTLVIITHDDLVAKRAHRTIYIQDGRILDPARQ